MSIPAKQQKSAAHDELLRPTGGMWWGCGHQSPWGYVSNPCPYCSGHLPLPPDQPPIPPGAAAYVPPDHRPSAVDVVVISSTDGYNSTVWGVAENEVMALTMLRLRFAAEPEEATYRLWGDRVFHVPTGIAGIVMKFTFESFTVGEPHSI